MVQLSDVHKYPFSLFSNIKILLNNQNESKLNKIGLINELFDNKIGKNIFKIKGIVSANNYLDFNYLNLKGNYLCLQLSLLFNSICTLHIELITINNILLRITISTLYDTIRFLGRSLRIPLNIKPGWTNLIIDINDILTNNCPANFGLLKAIKRIQLCSNMLVRDLITNDTEFVPSINGIKELAVISSAASIPWVNLTQPSDNIVAGPEPDISSPEPTLHSSPLVPEVAKKVTIASNSKDSQVNSNNFSKNSLKTDDFEPKDLRTPSSSKFQRSKVLEPDTPDLLNMEDNTPQTVKDWTEYNAAKYDVNQRNQPSRSRIATPKVTPHRVTMDNTDKSFSPNIVNPVVKVTNVNERVIGLERVLGYQGGPTALLYNGDMMAIACGSFVILTDLRSKDGPDNKQKDKYSTGLWKAFKTSSINRGYETDQYPQAYLKGHTSKVSIIEVSMDGRLMATCESGRKARLFIWDLQEGKRLAVLQPHVESVHTICFNPESTLLCTSGWDHVRREQIVVWNIAVLVQMSSGYNTKESSISLVVARQLSDFHISKIMFSPFFEDGLVSCGRENIRFWRMKKGHLPGRPVQLNEFSRGYLFTDLAYANAPQVGKEQSDTLLPCVFVSSSKGMLLRVDCRQEQVVCAYQLHNGPIRSLAMNNSFAVTGGDDCRMRIWPLHFTDFLMEAQHEAPVTHTYISQNSRYLSVGTASGTLGVLDVFDHRYWTILRSHVGSISSISARYPVGEEFMTLGADHTIRLWDSVSGQQKFEFDSPQDTPLCGAYHPFAHLIACGFSSGTLRIFDVQSTSTLFERSPQSSHCSPIVKLIFSHNNSYSNDSTWVTQVKLYTLSLSGRLTTYDTLNNYIPIRTITLNGNPWESLPSNSNDDYSNRFAGMMHLSLSKDNQFLAVCCGSIGSLTIFDTTELVPIHRGSSFHRNATSHITQLNDLSSSNNNNSNGNNNNNGNNNVYSQMSSTIQTNSTTAITTTTTNVTTQNSFLNIGRSSTTVRGLLFCLEKSERSLLEDENTLILVTDKNIISITLPVQGTKTPRTAPVLESAYATSFSSDDVSWRRIEGGICPVFGVIARDHPSGLLFLGIRRAGGEVNPNVSPTTPIIGDAIAILGVTSKRVRDPKSLRLCSRLSITPLQIIIDLPGDKNIVSMTPCGPASNKILTTDSSGCISVWYLREDRIEQLKSKTTSIQPESPLEGNNDDSIWIENTQLSELNKNHNNIKVDYEENNKEHDVNDEDEDDIINNHHNHNKVIDVTEIDNDYEIDYENKESINKINLEQEFENEFMNLKLEDLQNDDELKHNDDYLKSESKFVSVDSSHIENTNSIKSNNLSDKLKNSLESFKNQNQNQNQDYKSKKLKNEGKIFKTSFKLIEETKNIKDINVNKNKKSSDLFDKNKTKTKDNSFKNEKTSLEEKKSTLINDNNIESNNFEIIDESIEPINFEYHNCDVLNQPTVDLMKNSHFPSRILTQEITRNPSFCNSKRLLLTTNRSEIFLENIDSHSEFSLLRYNLLNDGCAIVHETSISPNGLLIAAVVNVQSKEYPNSYSELHIWNLTSNELNEKYWTHLGGVSLHSTLVLNSKKDLNNLNYPHSGPVIDWTNDDSLILLVPVAIPNLNRENINQLNNNKESQTGALLSITNWKQSEVSTLHIDMPGIPLLLPSIAISPEKVLYIKTLNDNECTLLIQCKSKLGLYVINTLNSDIQYPLWISDSGPSGPFLSVGIGYYHHTQHLSNDNIRLSKSRKSCEYPDCAISTPTYSQGHSYKETLLKREVHSRISESIHGSSCNCSPDIIFSVFPLLVALDSLGGVTCSRLTFQPTPLSCSTKVSASHISGSPRTMDLSPCGTLLILGSSTSLIQLFSLKVKDFPDQRFSVTLTLLSKITVPFSIDYLSFIQYPTNSSSSSLSSSSLNNSSLSQYEILSSSKTGNIGKISLNGLSKNSKVKLNPVKIIRSSPPIEQIDNMCTIITSEGFGISISNQRNGTLAIMNSISGDSISIPKIPTGVHSCSCITSYHGILLAYGSKCGRLSIYSTNTMTLIHMTSHNHNQINNNNNNNQNNLKSIKQIVFLYGGQRIILQHEDNTLSIVSTNPLDNKTYSLIKYKKYSKDYMIDFEIIPIENCDDMFIIRQGDILSLYTINELLECIHTTTFHFVTPILPIIVGEYYRTDFRYDDMTSKEKLNRFIELNKPLSIFPSKTIISKLNNSDNLFQITVLGGIGSRVIIESEQFILVGSVKLNQIIQQSENNILLYSCYCIGKIITSTYNEVLLAIIRNDHTLHIINLFQLHENFQYLLQSFQINKTNNSKNDEIEFVEPYRSIQHIKEQSEFLYNHSNIISSYSGRFKIISNLLGSNISNYVVSIQSNYEEEWKNLSVYVSYKNFNCQSIYEVVVNR